MGMRRELELLRRLPERTSPAFLASQGVLPACRLETSSDFNRSRDCARKTDRACDHRPKQGTRDGNTKVLKFVRERSMGNCEIVQTTRTQSMLSRHEGPEKAWNYNAGREKNRDLADQQPQESQHSLKSHTGVPVRLEIGTGLFQLRPTEHRGSPCEHVLTLNPWHFHRGRGTTRNPIT